MLLWLDVARSGPLNMAIDELLPSLAPGPVLRFYGWSAATISIGYFTPWRSAAGLGVDEGSVEIVRRPSGGGLVDHRFGTTFSLAVPAGHGAAARAPLDLYREIHAALGEVLGAFGVSCVLAGQASRGSAEATGEACFRRPVRHDLVLPDGRKVAGGAQKRARQGFLHQGQVVVPGEGGGIAVTEMARGLAEALAARWDELGDPIPGLLERAGERAADRYARASWTERR